VQVYKYRLFAQFELATTSHLYLVGDLEVAIVGLQSNPNYRLFSLSLIFQLGF